MKTIFSLVLLALVLGLGQTAAGGEPTVYHSSNGVDSGRPAYLGTTSNETIKLYVSAGSIESNGGTTACDDGNGDEFCGIDVIVEIEGDGQFTGFAKNGNVVHYPEGTTFTSPSSSFRLNVVQGTSPPTAGPQLLGTLTLDNTGPEGSDVTARGHVVEADLALNDIPERTIALPEPNGLLLLVSGIFGLAVLNRLRGRS
jgi:hypothetical protein